MSSNTTVLPGRRSLPCAIPDTPLAAAVPGIETCVHCGFCLQACPTYVNLEDENDSPRGRIVLMRSLVEGELALDDPSVQTHIDRCLGCRACETACPSGVPYGQLLEATRATLREVRPTPFLGRMILSVFARAKALRLVMIGSSLMRATGLPALFANIGGRLGFASAMLMSTRTSFPEREYDFGLPGARGIVALLEGCVMRGLYARTNRATRRTLRANDYRVRPAPDQVCCGALHAHAGDLETARELAKQNIVAFEHTGADFIAVNAAGCGAMMKEYGHLLANDPEWAQRAATLSAKVKDVSELLAAAGPRQGGALPIRVTYDAPCHLIHAQRIVAPPLAVLRAIPELELLPLTDAEQCCGAAGIYNLIEPTTSDAVLAPKLRHIASTGADWVVTGNPGCLMQIGAGLRRAHARARAVHPVDLLDVSYARSASSR
ncbi:MAG TPA: heterodisulfide reductase-related iron-sulfur binding cluster [Gemmatimonadaceae bacterium]|nr:heterodisulfide reductase-related iron-sulfur binding cluster [Gemmatimonadaceae bacterium]